MCWLCPHPISFDPVLTTWFTFYISVDVCDEPTAVCRNGGTCISVPRDATHVAYYTCQCPPAYNGTYCEQSFTTEAPTQAPTTDEITTRPTQRRTTESMRTTESGTTKTIVRTTQPPPAVTTMAATTVRAQTTQPNTPIAPSGPPGNAQYKFYIM